MRRTRMLLSVAAAAAVGGLTAVGVPSAAMADFTPPEIDVAVEVAAPTASMPCVETTGAKVCFMANGDKWYVKDTKADSASAVTFWHIPDSNGEWVRWGSCRNTLGNGKWGMCNKNYTEGSKIQASATAYDYSTEKVVSTSFNVEFIA